GLYPCYYNHDGVKKELMMTQFESHHARQVFPCVDEPAAKATFDLTLTTETGVTVLGNMPHKSQKIDNRRLLTEFETTPVMSTYLLAFIVGDLQKITAQTKSGVEVNVYATPAQPSENLSFALDHAVKTIEFFDEYFDEPYPLPKSDHVAVPDFSSGAMENWGLITYREIALLTEPTGSNISSRQYIATVVSHELSHQWFGNLVTMKWWNNLWLNESFATLMEYVAVDALQPSWNIWQSFATYESLLALRRDSIDGVQSVQIDVHHPDELNTVFDGAIVYAKGARLLYMLKNYIGDKAFRDGLRLYFNKHKYSNTAETDLWETLSETSGKDISKFMTPWISQPGFPIISVKHSDDGVTLTQDQFFVGPHEDSDRTWPIPLGSSDRSIPELMDTKEITIKASNSFILNEAGSAHFITKYDEVGADNLLASIDRQTETIRMQLLNERLMLARAGLIDSAKLIDWLIAYRHETSQPVWDIIATAIGDLKKFVENDEDAEKRLRGLVCEISQSMYEKLGWDHDVNESSETTKLRSTIISLAIYGQCQPAIEKALEIYNSMPLEKIDSEIRSMIIATVVREDADKATI
ncbi:MAG: M1 family metallopeptidase, partial [Candidatus Saccharimonadaceae bacterium]